MKKVTTRLAIGWKLPLEIENWLDTYFKNKIEKR